MPEIGKSKIHFFTWIDSDSFKEAVVFVPCEKGVNVCLNKDQFYY